MAIPGLRRRSARRRLACALLASTALVAATALSPRVARAQEGPFVYVPNRIGDNVSVIDIPSQAVQPGTIGVGSTPFEAAVRGDQSLVYVSNGNNDTVSVIDTASNTVIATVNVGDRPIGLAVSADGSRVYVANANDDSVSVINAANNTVIASIAVGDSPVWIRVSPDGRRAYVANQFSDNVSVIDTATNTVTATVNVGTSPLATAVSPDGSRVYVTNAFDNSVSVINTANNTVIASIAVGNFPDGITISPDGSRVYVANPVSDTVSVIDTATNTVTATIPVGDASLGVAISPDGSRLYVTNEFDGTVSVIDTATNAVVATLAVGNVPGYPGACGNGNALLTAGNTFVAKQNGALGCTGAGGPVFTGGTLQIAAATITSALPMVLGAQGGTIDTQANTATFSGAITGAGGLTKIGTGLLILSGANTYSGPTNVNAGTLQAGAANAFSAASAFNVLAGATLDLNNFNQTIGSLAGAGNVLLGAATLTAGGDDSSTTFSGVITGTGGLTKTGTGTLILTGNNSYAGTTTIAQGILQLGNGGTTGALGAGDVVNNATLAINRSNTLTLANVISGTGAFEQNGTGTTILTGANTYTGATTVNGGVLQLGNGGASGSLGSGNVVNNATLAVNRSDTLTLANVISGTGAFEQNGTGATILTGANTYTGATTVNAGILAVNGSLVSTVNVNGGTIGGTGAIGGLNVNNGTLSPGNSIGTLTVNGSLTMTAAATYLVEVSPAAADRTSVTGTAQLAGTVNAVFANGSYVQRSYTIVSAAGGRSGAFGTLITTNLPDGFEASLGYTGTAAILNLTAVLGQQDIATGGLNRSQINVATALNTFFNNGGTLPPAFVTVFGLTGAPLGNALTQLSGEHATGMQQAGIQSMGLFLNAMLDPFVAGRNGGFGAALGYAPEKAYAADFPVKAPRVTTFEQRWNVWGAAYGGRNRTDGDAFVGSHDLSANAAGFAGGVDYRVSPGSVLGAAVAIGETRWNLGNLGKGESNAAQVGGYFSTRWNDAYLSAAVAGAWHDVDLSRTVTVAGADRLEADFDARSIGARLEGGWRFALPAFAGASHGLTPYAAVQVQSVRTPNYSERATFGAANFALSYARQTATDTRSELGAWLDGRKRLDSGALLVLRARAAWVHDFDPGRRVSALFQTLPGAGFVVDGAAAPKNSALTSAAAELKLRNGVTLIGKVDGEFAGRATTYAATGTLKYAW